MFRVDREGRIIDEAPCQEQKTLWTDVRKPDTSGDTEPVLRKFETGATRDLDENKYDYEAFFSPIVLERRAKYMHQKRFQADGSMRAGDNWQKGIPFDSYAKSLARHHQDILKLHRGYPVIDEKGQPVNIEDAICAAMFNLEGYLHELLKRKL